MKIKKFWQAALVAAAVLSLAACGEPAAQSVGTVGGRTNQELLEAVYQANLSDSLLQTYDSIDVENITYDENGNVDTVEESYTDDDVMLCNTMIGFMKYDDIKGILTGYRTDIEQPVVYYTAYGPGITNEEVRTLMYNTPIYTWTPEEEVETVEDKDGKLYITTLIPSEVALNDGFSIAPDEVLVTKYVANADTLQLEDISSYIRRPDGTEVLYMEAVLSYNTEPISVPEEYSAVFSGDNTVNITVVFDPGTPEEQTVVNEIPVGAFLQIWSNATLYHNTYADAACTVPFTRDLNSDEDATIYMAKNK